MLISVRYISASLKMSIQSSAQYFYIYLPHIWHLSTSVIWTPSTVIINITRKTLQVPFKSTAKEKNKKNKQSFKLYFPEQVFLVLLLAQLSIKHCPQLTHSEAHRVKAAFMIYDHLFFLSGKIILTINLKMMSCN